MTDVAHNFVQRWNEASERARPRGAGPTRPPPATCRSRRAARGRRGRRAGADHADGPRRPLYRAVAAPGAPAVPIERRRAERPRAVPRRDRRRAPHDLPREPVPRIPRASSRALDGRARARRRGGLRRARASRWARSAGRAGDPRFASVFAQLAALGAPSELHARGPRGRTPGGASTTSTSTRRSALVDDAWATIGSTNVAKRSFHGDTELNASFWDAPTARALRVELLREHLGVDTHALDDVTALRRYREVAAANRERRARGDRLAGLAVALDPGPVRGVSRERPALDRPARSWKMAARCRTDSSS